ncbi:MAG: HEAT repeat domain-containing protein [Pseudomonadota bacterium]
MTIGLVIACMLLLPSAAAAGSKVDKLKDQGNSPGQYRKILEEIIDEGDAAIPDLASLLEEPAPADEIDRKKQWMIKVAAMDLVAELKAKDALAILENLLVNSENLSAIFNSARTIGRIGGNQAYKILEDALENARNGEYTQTADRKRAIVMAMGLCGDGKAIPYLATEMENPENEMILRVYAAGSLGMLEDGQGLGLALAALDSDDPYLRTAAIRSLGVIGSAQSIPALTAIVENGTLLGHHQEIRLALAQIEAAQLDGDDRVNFVRNQLKSHPKETLFLRWGTEKLKNINSAASKKALEDLGAETDPELEILADTARIKFKAMK